MCLAAWKEGRRKEEGEGKGGEKGGNVPRLWSDINQLMP